MNVDDAIAATSRYIDDGARDVVTVSGNDAATYLHSQLSQDVAGIGTGGARWSLVLEPTGKITSLIRVHRRADDRFELDTDAGFGAELVARLERFKIRVAATVELAAATRAQPDMGHEIARIDAGWPRMGHEIVAGETIPAAVGVSPVAVSFTKGCYPGQELVERMDSRGADAPVVLRIVDLAEGDAVGAEVFDADGEPIGSVTSASGDGGVGLAMVKRGSTVGREPTWPGASDVGTVPQAP